MTAGSKADTVTGETLKQLYENGTGNTYLNQMESSEQSLCSDRDPRAVTFEEIVRMSRDGGWDDVTLICADGRFRTNGFLLAAMFPVIRSMVSDVLLDHDAFISLPDVRVANLKMLFHSIHQKNAIIRVGDGISHLVSSNLLCLEIKSYDEADDNKDHDYLGNGSEDEGGKLGHFDDIERISTRKKSYDELEEIMSKIKTESICGMCGRRVRRWKKSFENKKIIEDQDGFKCRRCSKKKVPCELCGQMVSLSAMRRHIKLQKCLEPTKYQCLGECGNSECRYKPKYPKDLRRRHIDGHYMVAHYKVSHYN